MNKTALVLSLSLAAAIGYHFWSVSDIQEERDTLRTQSAELTESVAALTTSQQSSTLELQQTKAALERLQVQVESTGRETTAREAKQRAGAALAAAKTAFEAMDAKAFLRASFALIDLGEHGFPALTDLLNDVDMSRLDDIGKDLDGSLASKALLLSGILARMPKLTHFMDHILSRDPSLDNSSVIALHMISRFQIPGLEPGERVSRINDLVELAAQARQNGEDSSRVNSILFGGVRALSESKDPGSVAALEKLYGQDHDAFGWSVPSALAGMGTPESATALGNMFRDQTDEQPNWVLNHLGSMEGEHANNELWGLLGNEENENRRTQLYRSLAGRPENGDRLVDALRDPSTTAADRMAIISSAEGRSQEGTRAVVWSLYDAADTPRDRDAAIQRLVSTGDTRASEYAMDRLTSGSYTASLHGAFHGFSPAVARTRAPDLLALAGDTGRSTLDRYHAAVAAAKADRGNAVHALLNGFDSLAPAKQVEVINHLGAWSLRGQSARSALESISDSDAADVVRSAATTGLNVYQ